MLPHNLLSIPQIQREGHAGSKLMHLATLLEYVLKLYNPNVIAAEEGKDPKVGERVIACQVLFSDFRRVLSALKVRNSFAHVTENQFSEREHRNAVDCLIEAIGDVCRQPQIPNELKLAIYHDPDAGLKDRQVEEERRRREQQTQIERDKRDQAAQAQKLQAEEARLRETRRQQDRREIDLERQRARRQSIISAFKWLIPVAALLIGVYFFWPKLVTLYKGDLNETVVVRTTASLALKNVQQKKKQTEYGVVINQAEAAWRDGEIEFKKGNYKLAEGKYRQLISLWDGLNAQIAESMSFEELQAEVNTLRQAAKNAQAMQRAAESWNQAEELRRNAVTARKSGNLQEAKNLIIQARHQYEIAQATALIPAGGSTDQTQTTEVGGGSKTEDSGKLPSPGSASPSPPAPSPIAQPPAASIPVAQPSERTDDDKADDEDFELEEKEFMRYVTSRVNPIISPQAKSAGVSGPVVIEIHLSKWGHLAKASVIEGDPLLRESALAALRQWRFKPYLRDRVPTAVKSEMTIDVR